MHRNYKALEDLAKSNDYCTKTFMITELDSEFDYMCGYCVKLDIWEIMKFKKIVIAYNILKKPIYKYVKCNETTIFSGTKEEVFNQFYKIQGLI